MMAMNSEKSTQEKPTLSSKDKALFCARGALEKKAGEITILKIGPVSTIAEYFVICSGRSIRQTRAISDHLQMHCKKNGIHRPLGVEGEQEGSWILLDYDDVVVHIFLEPTRELYSLEKLWSEAPLLMDPEIQEALAM